MTRPAIADTRRMAETRSGSGRSPSGGGARSAIAQKPPPKHPGPRITAKTCSGCGKQLCREAKGDRCLACIRAAKTHCVNGHPRNAENAKYYKGKIKGCRACNRIYMERARKVREAARWARRRQIIKDTPPIVLPDEGPRVFAGARMPTFSGMDQVEAARRQQAAEGSRRLAEAINRLPRSAGGPA